ncbi:MAG: winged helix-turn-helix domain-containing protein, partial [Fibrella sp.]|nr:winged helix-turn-helix domain-containing protein [Armatimonadota bacterium]
MTVPISVSRADARRFLIDAFALDGFQTLPDVHAALETLGFVQEDSINVCGRIHDLIL